MRHQNLIGIDISDSSIKVLQLDGGGSIRAYGNDTLPPGVVEKGRIVDIEAFSTRLNDVLKQTKPNVLYSEDALLRAVLCLPESKLFTHYLFLPDTIKKADIETYVCADAEKIIPFELKDMYWDYHVAEEDGKRNATFVGVAKSDLDNYVEAFTSAKVRPAFIGGELFSLGYALLPEPPLKEDYCIIDIGAHSTTIGIFSIDAIANASIKVPLGGEHFTQAVAEKLALSFVEAEELKRRYGVDTQYEYTGVPEVLRGNLKEIANKVNEAKAYFEKKTGNPITHSILGGGSALMPQITEFFKEQIGNEVQIANPLLKIKNHEVLEQDMPKVLFANVIGLALYGIDTKQLRINLLTQYRYQESNADKKLPTLRDIRSLGDFYYVTYGYMQKGKNIVLRITQYAHAIQKLNIRLLACVALLIGALGFFTWVVITYL